MRIASADIMMASARRFVEIDIETEDIEAWVGDRDPRATLPVDSVSFSSEARDMLCAEKDVREAGSLDFEPAPGDGVFLLKLLMEAMTGKKIKVMDVSKLDGEIEDIEAVGTEMKEAAEAPEREGWGLVYNHTQSHEEEEVTSFRAEGVVKTSDGREIKFSLGLVMQREFATSSAVNIRAGDAVLKDPLVINFGGEAAGLSDMRFTFDLDSDGTTEDMPFVKQGSGFLVFDRNGNGAADDGKELFGPATGNGFGELKAYDADGNNWIDENDGIYSNLRLWTKDAGGADSLYTLQDKGVGAIYLGSKATTFDLRDYSNSLDGRVVSSGVYLCEDGNAGTVQQIDLAV